jgi:hypothetical protein
MQLGPNIPWLDPGLLLFYPIIETVSPKSVFECENAASLHLTSSLCSVFSIQLHHLGTRSQRRDSNALTSLILRHCSRQSGLEINPCKLQIPVWHTRQCKSTGHSIILQKYIRRRLRDTKRRLRNLSRNFVNAAYLTDNPIDKAGCEVTSISMRDEVLITIPTTHSTLTVCT